MDSEELIIIYVVAAIFLIGFIEITFLMIFSIVKSRRINDDINDLYWKINASKNELEENTKTISQRISDVKGSILSSINHSQEESRRSRALLENHFAETGQRFSEVIQLSSSNKMSIEDLVQRQILQINNNMVKNKNEIIVKIRTAEENFEKKQISNNKTQIETLKNSEEKIQKAITKIQKDENEISEELKSINSIWKKHLETLKPLEDRLIEINILYQTLLEMEKRFVEQEQSINSMVASHLEIADLTNKLNETASNVFELMRLYLMNSIVECTSIEKLGNGVFK